LDEVRDAVAAALDAKGPVLIDVAVDPSFTPV
jgi:thiamine pyrophosphate-dependent acetolactate synthase large subunit-like protein